MKNYKQFNLIEIINKEQLEELKEDYELDSDEEVLEYFELNGEIMLSKNNWENNTYQFHCGPSIGNGCVSDSVFICDYLETKLKQIGLLRNCDLNIAENYHMFRFDNIEDADKVKEICTDTDAWRYAERCASMYNPDSVWTMDIAKIGNSHGLLEIGCFSCAGLYGNNLDVVVERVSEMALKEWNEYNI